MITEGQGVRIAAYGRIPGHRDALFKQKAAMIQRFSEIISSRANSQYSGVEGEWGVGSQRKGSMPPSRCAGIAEPFSVLKYGTALIRTKR